MITKDEEKEFWEFVGFKEHDLTWYYPNGEKCFASALGTFTRPPSIDINNLFKYAVPKLKEAGWMVRVQYSPLRDNDTGTQISDWTGYASAYYINNDNNLSLSSYSHINPDPTEALFYLIYKVLKDNH